MSVFHQIITHFIDGILSNFGRFLLYYQLHHIFSEGQKYANDTEAKFHKWKCDPSHKILEGITYGTINATTSDNAAEYWGIEEGREVQLHIFHVQVCNTMAPENALGLKCGKDNGRGKGISIGLGQKFYDYGILVAEIVDMMNKSEHKEDVEKMLQLLQLSEHRVQVPEL